MVNQFYTPGEHRASRVNDLFAAIAPRYDLINDLQSLGLHRCWKRRLVRLAGARAGERALDLCCGTGDVALALAAQGAQVVGLDFSAPMLALARARGLLLENRSANHPSPGGRLPTPVVFLRGDAMTMPFSDNSFDIVTIAYGLRNLANLEQGLGEMVRVAKPGGRLLVLDFGKPDNALWRSLYFGYLKRLVPMFGKIFCGNRETHDYILESLKHYPAQSGVAAKMRRLNCVNTRLWDLLGGAMSIHYGEKPV